MTKAAVFGAPEDRVSAPGNRFEQVTRLAWLVIHALLFGAVSCRAADPPVTPSAPPRIAEAPAPAVSSTVREEARNGPPTSSAPIVEARPEPSLAPPGAPLVITPMRIVAKMSRRVFTVELEADGSLLFMGKPIAKVVGPQILDLQGKPVLSARGDQTIDVEDERPIRIDGRGGAETSEGVSIVIDDRGAVKATEADGKPVRDLNASVVPFVPAMRRTALAVFIAFFGVNASKRAPKSGP